MNKKLILWIMGMLVLASLVYALQESYPGLITVPNYYGSGDLERVEISEERTSVPILNNAENFIFMSPEEWIQELRKFPPGGYKGKIDKCVQSDGLSEEECLQKLVGDYFVKFGLTEEQKSYVLGLSESDQKYLISTMGRSRGKKTYMVEWMKNHQMFDYITAHENTHTYTTQKIDLLNQIELEEKKLAEATAESKDELRKRLINKKKDGLFVSLWLELVGDNQEIHFTNYGQVNRKEMFSEAFAMIFNNLMIKKLESFDMAKDYTIVEKYVAAHLLLQCFGLYDTYDQITGTKTESAIDNWIAANEKTQDLKNKLNPIIFEKVGSCPPSQPSKIAYSGEAYSCKYNTKKGEINIETCESVEVAEYQDPGEDSVWVGYGDGGVVNYGTFKSKELVINIPVMDSFDYFADEDLDISFEDISEGQVIIPNVPGRKINYVEFDLSQDEEKESLIERKAMFNPAKVAESNNYGARAYVNNGGVKGEVTEEEKEFLLNSWGQSQAAIEDQKGSKEIVLKIINSEDVLENIQEYWEKTFVWLSR